jgi:membrane protease YdiL (CAAX protease family)
MHCYIRTPRPRTRITFPLGWPRFFSSIAAAVVLQAIVFGLVHSYQGWKPVLVITVLGVLYGTLVALRRDLRASMIVHAWPDIYEGYAKFLWLGRP